LNAIPRHRRLLVSGIALSAAFALFHSQLAAAIVTRGDDALRGGDVAAAMRFYARASDLDPNSTVAADRLAFNLALRHNRANALQAIAVAGFALGRSANEPSLYADRAFAELQLHEWRSAERDFGRAGELGHDARYDHFAGRMALHVADLTGAKRYALRALGADPSFAPARTFLRELR
jgi:tetratricopeptide (TPR) repeat protein